MRIFLLISFIFSISISGNNGLFRFANYIQDHMVLQRAPHRAVVWGFGASNIFTSLRIDGKVYTTMSREESANDLGESIWSVTLDPMTAEGPFDINVTQSGFTIVLHDVLFGDVWLCSGQSNMQMTVIDIFNATQEINNAGNYPKIRVFTAALKPAATPVEELLAIVENWAVASAASIGGASWQYMSAVCWLYGRTIHEALGGRPIGLVATSYGGTPIEAWLPPEALQDCGIPPNGQIPLEYFHESTPVLGLNNSNLYNAMIYPFTRMVLYGIIWYQGETNSIYNTDKYACTFSKLIPSWRKTWNERTNDSTDLYFPFGFVQISTMANTSTVIGNFPIIRWHQTFDVGFVPNNVVPKIFMAVSLDLRDDGNNGPHPRTKHDVGYRLSRAGLAIAYNQPVEYQGPIVSSVSYSSGNSYVNITYRAVQDIELRNTNGFEVCCLGSKCQNDSLWVPATVTGKNGLTITVTASNSCIGQPLFGLRYLWRETPCAYKQAAIYSSTDSNLPSPPYITFF